MIWVILYGKLLNRLKNLFKIVKIVWCAGKRIQSSYYPLVLSWLLLFGIMIIKMLYKHFNFSITGYHGARSCFARERLVGQLKRGDTTMEIIITTILSDPIIYRCRSCVGNCECAPMRDAMRSDLICYEWGEARIN